MDALLDRLKQAKIDTDVLGYEASQLLWPDIDKRMLMQILANQSLLLEAATLKGGA